MFPSFYYYSLCSLWARSLNLDELQWTQGGDRLNGFKLLYHFPHPQPYPWPNQRLAETAFELVIASFFLQ